MAAHGSALSRECSHRQQQWGQQTLLLITVIFLMLLGVITLPSQCRASPKCGEDEVGFTTLSMLAQITRRPLSPRFQAPSTESVMQTGVGRGCAEGLHYSETTCEAQGVDQSQNT